MSRNKETKDKVNLRKFIVIIIDCIVIFTIILLITPEDNRSDMAMVCFGGIPVVLIADIIKNYAECKKFTTSLCAIIAAVIGTSLPCMAGISNPEWFTVGFNKKEQTVLDTEVKHDAKLVDRAEEDTAIEIVVNDIDMGVFGQFYDVSYIRDGVVQLYPTLSENEKIDKIMDIIVRNIVSSTMSISEYMDSELNSGEYSILTGEANKEEILYRESKDMLDRQQRIDAITSYLNKRIGAYKLAGTSELARLIGHTYSDLSDNQTVNDNIYSNCSAISYYTEYYSLSSDIEKSKMYYEIGVRFNRIASIALDVYNQEKSQEYKNLYIDATYMSIAYYKLCKHSLVDNFRNDLYLARSYKVLASEKTKRDKIEYLEESIDILMTLANRSDIKTDSKREVYRNLYNALIDYKSVPKAYWNRYTEIYLDEKIELYKREIY